MSMKITGSRKLWHFTLMNGLSCKVIDTSDRPDVSSVLILLIMVNIDRNMILIRHIIRFASKTSLDVKLDWLRLLSSSPDIRCTRVSWLDFEPCFTICLNEFVCFILGGVVQSCVWLYLWCKRKIERKSINLLRDSSKRTGPYRFDTQ